MKALAINSAITKLTVAAKNEDKTVTAIYDIGMKQSETLLPAIQYVLEKTGLTPKDLDYTALCEGPGSFTGLRLGFSALKALQVANQTPVYGISTLKTYACPFFYMNETIISVIDAKKDRFYACGYKYGEEIFPEGDYTPEEIAGFIKDEKSIVIAGPDNIAFKNILLGILDKTTMLSVVQTVTTDTLFELAEDKIEKKEPPLKDFDGPVYLRASEAEVKLNDK